jgi:hypothetical protein
MEQKILYAFLYCFDTEESGYETLSIHRTREGAERAMEFHKAEKLKEWKEIFSIDGKEPPFKFGKYEDWKINEIEIQD